MCVASKLWYGEMRSRVRSDDLRARKPLRYTSSHMLFQAEHCDSLQTFLLTHSLGGGMLSAVRSLLVRVCVRRLPMPPHGGSAQQLLLRWVWKLGSPFRTMCVFGSSNFGRGNTELVEDKERGEWVTLA